MVSDRNMTSLAELILKKKTKKENKKFVVLQKNLS